MMNDSPITVANVAALADSEIEVPGIQSTMNSDEWNGYVRRMAPGAYDAYIDRQDAILTKRGHLNDEGSYVLNNAGPLARFRAWWRGITN